MNKTTRRKFSSEFKAKVALDALQERESIESLSRKYDLHPNQIMQWKKIYKEGGSQLFSGDRGNKSDAHEKLIDDLYRSIGELKVANDFLKKNLKGYL
jgi:transposase-like protein